MDTAKLRTRLVEPVGLLASASVSKSPHAQPEATRYGASLVKRGAKLSMHLGWFPDASDISLEEAQAGLDALVLRAAGFDLERGAPLDGTPEPRDVLDVACGLGGTLARLSALTSASLVGVDFDEGQLETARRAPWAQAGRATFQRADACALPFDDGSFDLVFSVEAAFHFRSRAAFFGEVARVLRPGGRLVMTDILHATATPGVTHVPPRDATVDDATAALDACFGPWRDPLGLEGNVQDLAAAAGLRLTSATDLSAGTLRSGEHFVGRGTSFEWPPEPGLSEISRGVTALTWLQARGHQRVMLLTFQR